jgi:hypothetical protein
MATVHEGLSFCTAMRMNFSASDTESWVEAPCWQCKGQQLAVLVHQDEDNLWMRCVACGAPMVSYNGRFLPGPQPMTMPQGLPPEEMRLWEEVRSCLGVGAYTASVMLCRKLLLHVAVSDGLPPKDKQNRAPNYAQAVKHLESTGVITTRMRPWIDRIRDVGNEANHEIPSIVEATALDVASFTHQLLRLAYEMDALMHVAEPTQTE